MKILRNNLNYIIFYLNIKNLFNNKLDKILLHIFNVCSKYYALGINFMGTIPSLL